MLKCHVKHMNCRETTQIRQRRDHVRSLILPLSLDYLTFICPQPVRTSRGSFLPVDWSFCSVLLWRPIPVSFKSRLPHVSKAAPEDLGERLTHIGSEGIASTTRFCQSNWTVVRHATFTVNHVYVLQAIEYALFFLWEFRARFTAASRQITKHKVSGAMITWRQNQNCI